MKYACGEMILTEIHWKQLLLRNGKYACGEIISPYSVET